MYNPERRATKLARNQSGAWLRELREKRGLSQRELARHVGVECCYTVISQLESGWGRIPPDRYQLWADALGVEPRVFVRTLMSYYDPVYDPVTFEITFRKGPESGPRTTRAGRSARSSPNGGTGQRQRAPTGEQP